MKSIGTAAKEALDVLAQDGLALFAVAVVPFGACAAVEEATKALVLPHIIEVQSLGSAYLFLARAAAIAIPLALLWWAIVSLAWLSVCEIFAQRDREEPLAIGLALRSGLSRYAAYFRSYGAFLIPAASVDIAGMLLAAAVMLFVAGTGGGMGSMFGAVALLGLGGIVLLPFWLWAEGFSFLIAPAAVRGEFGLEGYRRTRAWVRGRWPSLIGLRVILVFAGFVADFLGWLLGMFLPSEPATDWSALLSMDVTQLKSLLTANLAPTALEWAHVLLDAVPETLVFIFGAAMAWRWLKDDVSVTKTRVANSSVASK